MDLLLVVIPITNGDSVGIQSKTCRKKGGENALDVKFDINANGCDGYIDTDPLVQDRDIVALPLTSFKPESRNMTSKESINVYVCAAKDLAKATSMKEVKSPGSTVTLI